MVSKWIRWRQEAMLDVHTHFGFGSLPSRKTTFLIRINRKLNEQIFKLFVETRQIEFKFNWNGMDTLFVFSFSLYSIHDTHPANCLSLSGLHSYHCTHWERKMVENKSCDKNKIQTILSGIVSF